MGKMQSSMEARGVTKRAARNGVAYAPFYESHGLKVAKQLEGIVQWMLGSCGGSGVRESRSATSEWQTVASSLQLVSVRHSRHSDEFSTHCHCHGNLATNDF
eukprot:4322982-Amphidinium_carterae.1